MELSVSIICCNNEATIGRTLDSVRGLGAEIVAVDSGSMDGTIGLLEQHSARVIRSPWLGYVKTRQLAMESCAGAWVLNLDSDESLMPALADAVKGAVARNDAGIAGYRVNRKVFYRDRPLNFAWQPEWRLRLVRRGQARAIGLEPHESLEVTSGGAVADLRGDLRHDSFSTFSEWLSKAAGHAKLSARSNHAAGKRSGYGSLLFSPPAAIVKQLILKQAWRDGWPGILAAGSVGAYVLMKHIALVELTKGGAMKDRRHGGTE